MNLFDGCSGKTLNDRLHWFNEPEDWRFGKDGLEICMKETCDFFRPFDGQERDSGRLLYTGISGDFTASTHIGANLVDFGDAGGLIVRAGAGLWAKLCMERSPTGDVSVVSVVTNTYSDDSNGELLSKPECHLRLTRKGQVFGMHHSLDGITWRFVRTFPLEMPSEVMVGVLVQAPFTQGCRVKFRHLNLSAEAVADFRSGE